MATVGLAGCGDDSDDSASSTDTAETVVDETAIEVTSTPFATLPPTSTTSPPTTTAPLQPGQIIETESTYTIVAGDFPANVAARFKVDLLEMLELNGFELVGQQVPDWPQPGTEIKIPAGATVPGAPATDTSSGTGADDTPTDDTATDGSATGATTGSTAAATPTTVDICAASEYEIQPGDTPSGVAAKFDTTVEELAAANAQTPSYDAFIAGFTIVIPPKTDC